MRTPPTPSVQAGAQLLAEIPRHWPMAKGSLAEVRKPCVRPNCPACASGRKHPAFLFSFTEQGRRRCLYVPRDLVPALRQAITNGRWMEEQMRRTGVWLVAEHRRHRTRTSPGQGGRAS
jgi:hypothetical protein